MELYLLDDQFRRITVIDKYESLIWTERFSSYGDFELNIFSTTENRTALALGTWIAVNTSLRMMKIETVENKVDTTGKAMINVTGKSVESILTERVAKDSLVNLTDDPTWTLTGTPGYIARTIFKNICVNGSLNVGDKLPFISDTTTIMPPSDIPEPSDSITLDLKPTTVYDALTSICETYDLGFRIIRNYDNSQFYFDVYSGRDLTTSQSSSSTNTPVIFSSNLDNLLDISELTSVSQYKNVAYVFSNVGTAVVYATGVDSSIAGFDRRILYVDATDVTYPTRAYSLTTDQITAINTALSLDSSLNNAGGALQKLIDKQRLSTEDVTAINNVINAPLVLSTQATDITNARIQSVNYNATEDATPYPTRTYTLTSSQITYVTQVKNLSSTSTAAKTSIQRILDKLRLSDNDVKLINDVIESGNLTFDQQVALRDTKLQSILYNAIEDAIVYPTRPYSLTASQIASITAVQGMLVKLRASKDALNKLLNKQRLLASDITAINNLTNSSSVTVSQVVNITSAKDASVAYNTTEDTAVTAILNARGKAELLKANNVIALDGEISQYGSYKYGVDYHLGDLVEMRNTDGVTNTMRVIEQIFVSDSQGERSYPTLAVNTIITPGSWYARSFSETWDDATDYWDNA